MKGKKVIKRNVLTLMLGIMCVVIVQFIFARIPFVKASISEHISIYEGASVRLSEHSSGIRFKGSITKEYLAWLENDSDVDKVTFGIIITPQFYLDNVADFTMEALEEKYSKDPYLKIPASKTIESDGQYEFQCAMTDIRVESYEWELAARSYVEITYKDQTIKHIYSHFDENENVRSIKEVAQKTLSDTSRVYTEQEVLVLKNYVRDDVFEQVYVSSVNGNDNNMGTQNSPYATLNQALKSVMNNGVIVVCDTCEVASDFVWEDRNKKIQITGDLDDEIEILDFSSKKNSVTMGDQVTFSEIEIEFAENANLYANGNSLVIEESVRLETPINLYGGGNGTTIDSTNIEVKAGNYYRIFGGGNGGTVEGDTNVTIGGNTNNLANPASHDGAYNVYGGGNNDVVKGDTYLTFSGNAQANYVFGGSSGTGKVKGTNVAFLGGKVMSLCGGNDQSSDISSVAVSVEGGEMEQLFGANQRASMTGDVEITLLGGKITRRIYAGCYNETSGTSWKSEYYVTGNVNLKIASGVNITLDAKDEEGTKYQDLSIYACSRHNTTHGGEVCTITFLDEAAYTKYNQKLGANDVAMGILMWGVEDYYTLIKLY